MNTRDRVLHVCADVFFMNWQQNDKVKRRGGKRRDWKKRKHKCERKLSMENSRTARTHFSPSSCCFITSHRTPTTTQAQHRRRRLAARTECERYFFMFCFPWPMFCESQTGCSTRSGDHISRQMVCVAQTVKCNTQQINSNNQFYECEW